MTLDNTKVHTTHLHKVKCVHFSFNCNLHNPQPHALTFALDLCYHFLTYKNTLTICTLSISLYLPRSLSLSLASILPNTHTHSPGQMAMPCMHLAQQMHKSINHETRLKQSLTPTTVVVLRVKRPDSFLNNSVSVYRFASLMDPLKQNTANSSYQQLMRWVDDKANGIIIIIIKL